MALTKKDLEELEAAGAKVKIKPKDITTFEDVLANLVKSNVDALSGALSGIKNSFETTVSNERQTTKVDFEAAVQTAVNDATHLFENQLKEAAANAEARASATEAAAKQHAMAVDAQMKEIQKVVSKPPPAPVIKKEIVERIVEKAPERQFTDWQLDIHRNDDGRMSAVVVRGDGTSPSYRFQVERDEGGVMTSVYATPMLM